jgi:hypothetical protein
VQAVRSQMQPFFNGDLQRTTRTPNSSRIKGREAEIRIHLLKNSKPAGCTAFLPAPFEHVHLQSSAPQASGTRLEFRLISTFFSHLNELCQQPLLVAEARLLWPASHPACMDCLNGPDSHACTADIPKCFRQLKNPEHLLQLFFIA